MLTTTEILDYVKGNKKHSSYITTCKLYTDLKVHMDGEYPAEIIDKARPNEPNHIKLYREQIFAHTTKPVCAKVVTSLSKIRKSHDWNIKFKEENVPAIISSKETPKQYYNFTFPQFGSITTWAFNVLLKQYLADANSLIVVMPISWKLAKNEYFKPFPFIYNSPSVVGFSEGNYAIVKSEEIEKGKYGEANVYYVITPTDYQKWSPNGSKEGYYMSEQLVHNIGKLPAFRAGGLGHKVIDRTFVWESRISPMVPFLNEAAREYSDLQAGVLQHLFLERWEIEGPKCKVCSGTGRVKKEKGSVKCPAKDCDSGAIMGNPYRPTIMRKGLPGETTPQVPAGYIDKNPEIIKIQDVRVDRHYFKALAAINMEFLALTPLVESGISKSVDREEAENFVHGVGEDVVVVLDKICYFGNEIRYTFVVPDPAKRELLLPNINVPEKLNVFTSQMIVEELAQMRTAKVSSSIIQAVEMEIIAKMFSYDSDVVALLQLSATLDPLPGYSMDEKASALLNKGTTMEMFIISVNIKTFVARAIKENPKFATLPLESQMEILKTYAGEVVVATDAAEKLKADNAEADPAI